MGCGGLPQFYWGFTFTPQNIAEAGPEGSENVHRCAAITIVQFSKAPNHGPALGLPTLAMAEKWSPAVRSLMDRASPAGARVVFHRRDVSPPVDC